MNKKAKYKLFSYMWNNKLIINQLEQS